MNFILNSKIQNQRKYTKITINNNNQNKQMKGMN